MNNTLKLLLFSTVSVLFFSFNSMNKLPIQEWPSSAQNKPLVFYLSGDGGMNSFSTSLCETLNKKGFDVSALNSKTYFWDKKTPEQTASDVAKYIAAKLNGRKNQQVVLIGYSFGADVLPFVLNRLPATINQKILVSFIMASSGNTDFEIHWADIFGHGKKRSMDVVSEINKINNDRIVILNGSDEEDLNLSKITLKKYTHEVIPGGHHFEGNIDEIVKVILNDIN
jgi:type IV secretory pathway VirJ component